MVGVMVAVEERFDGLDLWLASSLPGFCLLMVQRPAVERGLVSPALPWGASAVCVGGSFAYLALRPAGTEPDTGRVRFEFGVYAHGPDAEKLADRVAEQIRTWDRDHRSRATFRGSPGGRAGRAASRGTGHRQAAHPAHGLLA